MTRFKVGDEVRVKAGVAKFIDKQYRGLAPFTASFGVKLEIRRPMEDYDGIANWMLSDGTKDRDQVTENYLEPWNPAEEWDGEKWVPKKAVFTKGDSVKIVGPSFRGRTESIGKEGRIVSGPDVAGDYVVVPDGGFYQASSLEHFFKSDDHIVVLRENGVLKPNSPPHVHPSFDDASKEAKRLAAKHKGQEFCVFGLKAVERREETAADRFYRQLLTNEEEVFESYVEDEDDTFQLTRKAVSQDGDLVTITYKVIPD